MGLSGRKIKQRIPADPRNLSWADDAAKFGQNYLSKLGWDPSKGLGASGDGRTSHIKVSQKLDMLGIGAAQQKDPNGIAWKQNKDFENLLKRLNDNAALETRDTEDVEETEEKSTGEIEVDATGQGGEESKERKSEKKKKRKKCSEENQEVDEGKVKKKRKKSKTDEGSRKEDKSAEKSRATEEVSTITVAAPVTTAAPRPMHHRGHRARFIASKQLASKSAAAISEILGIAPTPSSSSTPSASATPLGTLTPIDDSVTLEKLTTSTKSVADYFKERLLAKSSKAGPTTATTVDQSSNEVAAADVPYDAPKRVLGSSRLRLEITQSEEGCAPPGIGSGAATNFSSLLGNGFAASSSTATFLSEKPSNPQEEEEPRGDGVSHKKGDGKKEKMKREKSANDSSGQVKGEDKTRRAERKKSKKDRRLTDVDTSVPGTQRKDDSSEKKLMKEARRQEKAERKVEKEKRRKEGDS